MPRHLLISLAVVFLLWTLMFSPWTAPFLPFWPLMTGSAVVLTLMAWLGGKNTLCQHFQERNLRLFIVDSLLGIGLAAALWGVFWIGDKVSQWLFPTIARVQVDNIYAMKSTLSPTLLSLLLLFIIGPAEELFWRGYVQRSLLNRYIENNTWDNVKGWLITALSIGIYAFVHILSFNFMLVMAALVCGAVWGVLYYLFPKHFTAILISHALWDAAVFVWFPI